MSLIIALPRERRSGERRVALDPSRVERLLQDGMQVRIEADCGHAASFYDEAYQGATVVENFAELVHDADIVVKVVCPTLEEIALLPAHCVVVCIMSAFQHLDELHALRERQITVLGMDHLPRTTRAQPMDALSSQATVAGYKAALLAAELSPRLFPMLTTAAGTIRPSRVLVVGAGVAGLQAIATARRLGAQVEAYDIRKAAKEQIESLGAKMIDTGVEVEGAGGIARALRKDEKQIQHDVLAEHMARAHVVICSAAIPGRRAPRIITEDMVDGMLPESVIVDMAASTGGNCELTRSGEHYYHNDTLIVGPLNLPSHGAVHASEMYSRNIHNMLELIITDGKVVLNPDDDIIARCVLMHEGRVSHAEIATLLELPEAPFGSAPPSSEEMSDETSGWLKEEEEAPTADSHDSASDADESSSSAAPSEPAETSRSVESSEAVRLSALSLAEAPAAADKSTVPGSDERESGRVEEESLNASITSTIENGVPDEQDVRDLAMLEGVDGDEMVRLAAQYDDSLPEDAQEEAALPSDELTLIDGVGPALQQRLYAFGFRQFLQLAELDDDGLEKLSVQLELDDEIREQDWRGQARRLMEEGL